MYNTRYFFNKHHDELKGIIYPKEWPKQLGRCRFYHTGQELDAAPNLATLYNINSKEEPEYHLEIIHLEKSFVDVSLRRVWQWSRAACLELHVFRKTGLSVWGWVQSAMWIACRDRYHLFIKCQIHMVETNLLCVCVVINGKCLTIMTKVP